MNFRRQSTIIRAAAFRLHVISVSKLVVFSEWNSSFMLKLHNANETNRKQKPGKLLTKQCDGECNVIESITNWIGVVLFSSTSLSPPFIFDDQLLKVLSLIHPAQPVYKRFSMLKMHLKRFSLRVGDWLQSNKTFR